MGTVEISFTVPNSFRGPKNFARYRHQFSANMPLPELIFSHG
jgi:hypothetical protein